MAIYKNYGGDSGIQSYEILEDRILVTFSSGKTYEYTYSSAGKDHIESMKLLALKGQGLNSYIGRYVKKLFSRII